MKSVELHIMSTDKIIEIIVRIITVVSYSISCIQYIHIHLAKNLS